MHHPALTGLRGLMALWVVLYHVRGETRKVEGHFLVPDFIGETGGVAVSVFFVLSGTLMSLCYDGCGDFGVHSCCKKAFWWRRFARLAPLYYLTLLIAAYTITALYDCLYVDACIASVVLTPLSLQALIPVGPVWNEVTWSISCETISYLLFPYLPHRDSPYLLRATVVVVFITLTLLPFSNIVLGVPRAAQWYSVYYRIWEFVLGALGTRVHLHLQLTSWLPDVITVGFFALMCCPTYTGWAELNRWNNCGYLALPILAMVLSLLESEGCYRGVARRLLSLPIMLWMGEVSYAAYLIHQHLRAIVDHDNLLYRPWILVTYIPLVAAVSWILHVYIEKPAHHWLIEKGKQRGWCCLSSTPAEDSGSATHLLVA